MLLEDTFDLGVSRYSAYVLVVLVAGLSYFKVGGLNRTPIPGLRWEGRKTDLRECNEIIQATQFFSFSRVFFRRGSGLDQGNIVGAGCLR